MSYFVPVSTTVRDYFLSDETIKYFKIIIDPDGTPSTFLPKDISCDASEDYQRWSFSVKNRVGLSVGLYANDSCVVQISHNNSDWITIFTGFVSDEGLRRSRGMITDDYVMLDLVDATKRKGTRRKPDKAILSNFTTVDTTTTTASVLHYLAGLMGATIESSDVTYTHEILEVGSSTAWSELQRLKEAFHADMYFRYDGKLLFRSPLEDSYSAPSSEWTFQADPSVAVSGNMCRVRGKLQEVYTPVRCNYAKTAFPDYNQLSPRVIYKNTTELSSETGYISIEVLAGEYWPGPNAGDVARLLYSDPDSGEEYPYAISVITPSIGVTGSSSAIEYTGGTLELISFNGSTTATSNEAGASQIILRNTGATCTIRKLAITGTPYSKVSDVVVEHVDSAVASAIDYIEQEIDGKYMVDSAQAFDTLYHVVEEGKGRPRQFAFDAPFMPWIQRRAIVNVQPPSESSVRCVVNTYNHKNKGRAFQGMRTSIVCTELGTHTPSGSPYIETAPSIPAWQAKLTAIAPNASATYRSASTTIPTNPKIGDYWYQTDTQLTKRYDGSDWQNVGASPLNESELVGISFQNDSGNVKIYDDGTLEAIDAKLNGTLRTGSGAPTDARVGIKDQSGIIAGPTFTGSGLNDLSIVSDGDTAVTARVRIEKKDYISSNILSSFDSPSDGPSGFAFDGTNLISCDYNSDKIYIHDGITGDILSSFTAPSTYPGGLAFHGINLISCDTVLGKIYIHDGITSNILSSFDTPSVRPIGLTFHGINLISCDYYSHKIYIHDGISGDILSSFDSPSATPYGLTFDGTNLISCEMYGVIYIHDSHDSFKVSDDDGGTYGSEIEIPASRTYDIPTYDITIGFGSRSGHTTGEYWAFEQGAMKGLVIEDSGGDEYFSASNGIIKTNDMEMFSCRAWVNFNGTGTVSIREDGNVGSITDRGEGRYRVNFTEAMSDTNYAVTGLVRDVNTNDANVTLGMQADQLKTTSYVEVVCSLSSYYDSSEVSVIVFR